MTFLQDRLVAVQQISDSSLGLSHTTNSSGCDLGQRTGRIPVNRKANFGQKMASVADLRLPFGLRKVDRYTDNFSMSHDPDQGRKIFRQTSEINLSLCGFAKIILLSLLNKYDICLLYFY